jgi:hypothetical protein
VNLDTKSLPLCGVESGRKCQSSNNFLIREMGFTNRPHFTWIKLQLLRGVASKPIYIPMSLRGFLYNCAGCETCYKIFTRTDSLWHLCSGSNTGSWPRFLIEYSCKTSHRNTSPGRNLKDRAQLQFSWNRVNSCDKALDRCQDQSLGQIQPRQKVQLISKIRYTTKYSDVFHLMN